MMAGIVQTIFDALLLIGLYSIGASGFGMIWGVLNLLNLSFGAFIMLGGYSIVLLSNCGIDPLLALPVTMLVLFTIGWGVQRGILNRVLDAPPSLAITLTYGLNLMITGAMLYFFSAEFRTVQLPKYLHGYFVLWGAQLTYARAATTAIALVVTAGVWWFIDRTELGMAIRATRLDSEAARLVGIRTKSIYQLVAGISSMLAGAMGGLAVLVFSVSPQMGDVWLLQIFVVTVLGGLGSVIGPLLGSIVVGLSNSIVGSYYGATYGTLVGTLLVLVVLLIRPAGLLGRRFYEV